MKRAPLTDEDLAIIEGRLRRLAAAWKLPAGLGLAIALRNAANDYREPQERLLVITPESLPGLVGRTPSFIMFDDFMVRSIPIDPAVVIRFEPPAPHPAEFRLPPMLEKKAPQYATQRERRDALRGKPHTVINRRQK